MSRPTSISISKKDLEKIHEIKDDLGISNTSDVFKRAISLYHYLLIDQQENNNRIILTSNQEGENMERIRIM